jgi:DNA-binding response OmpR family regulator
VTGKHTSTPPRLLVVDDDAKYGKWLGHHLGVFCPESTVTVLDLAGFERWCETDSGRDSDIVLLTAVFGSSPEDPKARGLEQLRRLRFRPVFPTVISVAEEGNELTAVRALQLGAVDYLPKRLLTPERLGTSVRLALRRIEKRVQRKLAGTTHITEVTPPPEEETREQPKILRPATEESAIAAAAVGPTPPPSANTAEGEGETHGRADNEFSASEIVAAALNGKLAAPEVPDAAGEGETHGKSAESAPIPDTSAPAILVSMTNGAPVATPTEAAATPVAPTLSPVTADSGSAAATQLMAPGQLEAILGSASAAALGTDHTFTGTNVKAARIKSPVKKKSGIASPAVTAEFIPGYIIKMKIGESEKAVVYLATSISLGANVALKVSKTLRDDTAGRQFLEREYTAIIAIRDPLVVQIYDYGVHAGFEYLAMEYLLRGDLKARMQAGLKELEALSYVEKIASALRVVHNAGLLHRDLKPPNVMLRENDDVALIDFGLARALDGSTPSTRTGVLRGSPYYMSPEQAQGEQLDVRSDFYSLGIMLYEMLTGRKPYTGATAMEVLQQHVNSPLPPLPHSLSRYESLLHKLAAKNRNERFGKAEEIIAAIGDLRAAITMNVESAVA